MSLPLFDEVKPHINGGIGQHYSEANAATALNGDRLSMLSSITDGSAQLVVTSPPYNIGKSYETRVDIQDYLDEQEKTIRECVRILSANGSLCWQVGNHITNDAEVIPLDIPIYSICKKFDLQLRNRIIWHFEHGLHCKNRFSGRYETILWFTKSKEYIFNLDPVRVPQKYPGKKNFKGAKVGEYSCNPLGKNPGDLWIIPNVKHNHCEKTEHPCQFPIELVERLVLALTEKDGLVVDPYMGVGSSICAAVLNQRRGAGSDTNKEYVDIAVERIQKAIEGTLAVRPMDRPVYQPSTTSSVAKPPFPTIDDGPQFSFDEK